MQNSKKKVFYATFSEKNDYLEDFQPNHEKTEITNEYSFDWYSIRSLALALFISVIVTLAVAFSGPISIISTGTTTSTTTNPNFVFILIDDLSWNSMGYMGSEISFATPYMTSLAKEGVILTNYYSQETCTPARAALLTGRYPISIGIQYATITSSSEWGLPLAETLLPEVLSGSDYISYIVGEFVVLFSPPIV